MTFEQSFRNGKMDQVAERRGGPTRLRKGVWEGAIVPALLFCLRVHFRPSFWDRLAMLTLPPCLSLQGIINLGTSENKLCFDLLSRRVSPVHVGAISSSQGPSALGLPGRLP